MVLSRLECPIGNPPTSPCNLCSPDNCVPNACVRLSTGSRFHGRAATLQDSARTAYAVPLTGVHLESEFQPSLPPRYPRHRLRCLLPLNQRRRTGRTPPRCTSPSRRQPLRNNPSASPLSRASSYRSSAPAHARGIPHHQADRAGSGRPHPHLRRQKSASA